MLSKRLNGVRNWVPAIGTVLAMGVLISSILAIRACHDARLPDDKDLVKQIQATLYQSATLRQRDISVIAHDGVVVLIGQVSSKDEKTSAERLASTVDGVKQVINQLVVVEGSPRTAFPLAKPLARPSHHYR